MTAFEPISHLGGLPADDSWIPLNLTSLPEEPPTPPEFGGFGIVYRGKRHVFSGPQESAKTIAAYAIGIEVLRNNPERQIMVIDFEMGPRATRTRFRELTASDEELSDILYVDPEAPANIGRIAALVALEPLLVIVDAASGAYSLQGFDDNSRSDAEKFNGLYIMPFFQAGIATIVIDHVVKNVDNRGKYTQGSGRKTEVGEVHLGFDTITAIKRGSTGLYKVLTHKDRDGWHQRGQLAELHLASDPDTHTISWEWRKAEHVEPGEEWMPTKLMQKISGLVEQKTEPVSRKTVLDELGGRPEYGRKAINHLIRLDYLSEDDGPRGAKLLTHIRPFTVLKWEEDHIVPPSPDIVPDQVNSHSPTSSPPNGGRGLGDAIPDHPHGPDEQTAWSWFDELTPTDPEDDDIPF